MRSRRSVRGSVLVVLFALGLAGAPTYVSSVEAATASMQQPRMEDVFVLFRGRPGPAEEALVGSVGATVRHRYAIVDAMAARVPSQALQGLRNNPRVALVEPDIEARAVHINSPAGTEIGNAWGVDRLDAEVVHAAGATGNGVRVAIVDSGSGPHVDLNIAAANRLGCIGQPCKSGSGSGYDDDHGHGTHVAGSAAAIAGNQAPFGGIVGVAPQATLISIKVLGASGGGSYSDIVAALDWLAAWSSANGKRIQVANFSLGSSQNPGSTVKAAFDNAYNAYNILTIAAAGNTGNPAGRGDNVIYPARWDSVVAVAATDRSDRRAIFSSTGPAVEIAAPGVDIWSAQPVNGNGYGYMSGTSMATPHVSGAAALIIAKVGLVDNAGVRTRLQTTAKNLGPSGRDQQYGHGLVDPLRSTGTAPGSLDSHR